jgi:hypothetical protein
MLAPGGDNLVDAVEHVAGELDLGVYLIRTLLNE